jgi:hypothetical protein
MERLRACQRGGTQPDGMAAGVGAAKQQGPAVGTAGPGLIKLQVPLQIEQLPLLQPEAHGAEQHCVGAQQVGAHEQDEQPELQLPQLALQAPVAHCDGALQALHEPVLQLLHEPVLQVLHVLHELAHGVQHVDTVAHDDEQQRPRRRASA